MVLWVDKYRPTSISKLEFHPHLANKLKNLAANDDYPHLLFYGPSGAGKKTLVTAFLKEVYGSGVEKCRIEQQTFSHPTSHKKIDITTLSSNYHIELNPSEVGLQDRVVIQEVIKLTASTNQVGGGQSAAGGSRSFKTIIITDVDRLTRDAQSALRRTMEKYMTTCRLILICESTSRVIAPIRSRCLPICVGAPSDESISSVLQYVAQKERLTLPDKMCQKMVLAANGNARKALLALEATKVQQYPFTDDQRVFQPDWERYLKATVDVIVQEQSAEQLLKVRNRLYELLAHCIPPSTIFTEMTRLLLEHCDHQLKIAVVREAAKFEHRLQRGQKAIFHLEAFIAKFMFLYANMMSSVAIDFGDDDDDLC